MLPPPQVKSQQSPVCKQKFVRVGFLSMWMLKGFMEMTWRLLQRGVCEFVSRQANLLEHVNRQCESLHWNLLVSRLQ